MKKLPKWEKEIMERKTADPDAVNVENRYRLIRHILIPKYAWLGTIPKETLLEVFKDVVSIDRKARLYTEGNQTTLKKHLSDKYIVENLQ